MSEFDREYEILFISHYEPSNKVWGWFARRHRSRGKSGEHKPHLLYAFWAVIGKTITVKTHRPWQNNLTWIKSKKLEGKYVEISTDMLLQLWPTFTDDMDQRLLFLRLSGDLEG